MVGTRNSLPNVSSSQPGNDLSVPKELRKLYIDGKDIMRGIQLPKPDPDPKKKKKNRVDTYTWRGVTYLVTPDTPQEWLDQDTERTARLARWAEEDRLEAEAEARAAQETRAGAKKTLKRKSTGTLDTSTADDDIMYPDTRRPTKRQRRNTTHVPTTSSTTSRLRKPSTTTTTTTTSPNTKRRAPSTTTQVATTNENEDEDENQNENENGIDQTLKFDYTTANRRRIESSIRTEKRAARQRGLTVDAIKEKDIVTPEQQQQLQMEKYQNTLGARLGRDIARIAKLNTAIATLSKQYEKLKDAGVFEALMKRKASRQNTQEGAEIGDEDEDEAEVVDLHDGAEIPSIEVTDEDDTSRRLANAVDEVYDERETRSQLDSQLNDDDSDDDPITLPNAIRDSQKLFSSESVSPERGSSKRQDSATTTTSPDLAPSPNNAPIADATTSKKKASPFSNLPEKNRGGQTLRWSLGGNNGISKEARYSGTDRAENLIHRGRMNGESASARRRRVARELKFLQSLPVDEEESAKLRAAAGVAA